MNSNIDSSSPRRHEETFVVSVALLPYYEKLAIGREMNDREAVADSLTDIADERATYLEKGYRKDAVHDGCRLAKSIVDAYVSV